MSKQNERNFLKILFLLSISFLIYLFKKPPIKDWVLVFLLKSYIASILDTITVKKGFIKYSVRIFKIFDKSILFSHLIFPVIAFFSIKSQVNQNYQGSYSNVYFSVYLQQQQNFSLKNIQNLFNTRKIGTLCIALLLLPLHF